jgi:osmotically-inducible protein OsmY
MRVLRASIITLSAAAVFAFAPVSATATPGGQNYASSKTPVAKSTVQSQPVDDSTLTDRIETRYKGDASLKKYDIDVSVDHGVATLTGKVRTQAEKARAERDARIAGITKVDNRLTLDKDAGKGFVDDMKSTTNTVGKKSKDTADTVGTKTKNAAETAGEKTKNAAETAGDKTKAGVNKSGEVITDAWITTKVHSRFVGEDVLKGSDIDVDTNNHVVTLKGTVKSQAARARAVEIARATDGVTKVVDTLTIK